MDTTTEQKPGKAAFVKKSGYTGNFCCVPYCFNSSGKDKTNGEKRSYYRFPGHDARRKLWLKAIPREKWTPKKSDRVCSDHFKGGRKTEAAGSEGYIPTHFPGADAAKGKQRPQGRQTETSKRTPTVAPDSQPRRKSSQHKVKQKTQSKLGRPKARAELFPDDDQPVHHRDHDYLRTTKQHGPMTYEQHLKNEMNNMQEILELCKGKVLSADSLKGEKFRRFTNLPNKEVFDCVCTYLHHRAGQNLRYWHGSQTQSCEHFVDKGYSSKPGPERKLSFREELFLVLVKLKTGFQNTEMSVLFGICETLVGQIFTTFVNFMAQELKLLFEMPETEEQDCASAECFKKYGPNLKIVVDCTEIECQKSSNLRARKAFYSNYKGRDTVKFMVGLSPYLLVNYISKGWGGRASDKKIFLSSEELTGKLPGGSSVMADRGFLVGAELKEQGVKLIIPDFKGRGRSQLTRKECEASEEIAKSRIHVERIIQRIRSFHILGRVMPLSTKDIYEQVFIVCSYLTNFQLPIIQPD